MLSFTEGPSPSVALVADAQRERLILDRVRAIPEGFVATYGDCCPGAPRMTGRVLASCGSDVPWWRVVRADGSLAQGERQRELLEAEGVPVLRGRVVMSEARFGGPLA